MNHLVSVIIPTYNRFEYLLNAIQSVITQTYRPIELIIVNDGSTDNKYYQYDFNHFINPISNTHNTHNITINIIHLPESSNKKLGYPCGSVPRNKGMELSTGDYIAFLDDDDVWFPNKLEIQMTHTLDKNALFSCTDGYIGNGCYNPNNRYPLYNREHYWIPLKTIFNLDTDFPDVFDLELVSIHNPIVTSSVLISKQLIDKVGKMELIRNGGELINGKKDWQDWNYWKRCLKIENKCLYVKEPLFYYDLK